LPDVGSVEQKIEKLLFFCEEVLSLDYSRAEVGPDARALLLRLYFQARP
jgi:hypothetical protein